MEIMELVRARCNDNGCRLAHNILEWFRIQSMDIEETWNALKEIFEGYLTKIELLEIMCSENEEWLLYFLEEEFESASHMDNWDATMSCFLCYIKEDAFPEAYGYLKKGVNALSDEKINRLLEKYGDLEYVHCVNGNIVSYASGDNAELKAEVYEIVCKNDFPKTGKFNVTVETGGRMFYTQGDKPSSDYTWAEFAEWLIGDMKEAEVDLNDSHIVSIKYAGRLD